MGNKSLMTIAALVLIAGGVQVMAGETELSGFVAGDLRLFPRFPVHAGQSTAVADPSLMIQPELRYKWNGGNDRITSIPFGRLDALDKERTHFDLRELNWIHVGEDWDLRLGVDKIFWGVTESRHLVDVINQTDLVEDIDEEDKLGQPMINLGLHFHWGNLKGLSFLSFENELFQDARDVFEVQPLWIPARPSMNLPFRNGIRT